MILPIIQPVEVSEITPAYLGMVDYLCERPEQILFAWMDPNYHRAGGLFRYARAHNLADLECKGRCGCLTMIRGEADRCAAGPFGSIITESIRTDEELPALVNRLTSRQQLIRFAQWQTFLDKLWGRSELKFHL